MERARVREDYWFPRLRAVNSDPLSHVARKNPDAYIKMVGIQGNPPTHSPSSMNVAEEIKGGTESGGSIHMAEECKQEMDRKTGDVANKAMGAAESDADPPPVPAKDESKQPSSNKTRESSFAAHSAATTPGTLKAAEPTPQKDGSSAGQKHHEKGQPSAAAGSTGTLHAPVT